jgi:hypothetical protein
MEKQIKAVGMLHIPGQNDKQWKEYLKENKKKQQVKNNLWYHPSQNLFNIWSIFSNININFKTETK